MPRHLSSSTGTSGRRVLDDHRSSRIDSARNHIISFDQAFARATRDTTPPLSQRTQSAQPNNDHYSLSRWAHENSRESPFSHPQTTSRSYAQQRWENETSRQQPWNNLQAVSVDRRVESARVRDADTGSLVYYDPSREQLGQERIYWR